MSFGNRILEVFGSLGERVAMITDRERLTYAQALAEIENLATHFLSAGITAGDRVGLAMADNIDVTISILAAWRIDATPVSIDFRTPRGQRARLARDFRLSVILESRSVAGNERYPSVIFDREWRFTRAPIARAAAAPTCVHPAFLIFSSGTTGDPKAYVQPHDALAARIAGRKSVVTDTGQQRFLTPMALTYSATRHQIFSYLLQGGVVRFFPPLFSPSELIEGLLSFRASGTALPPPVIARMVKEAGRSERHLLPELSILYSVGGPANAEDKVTAYCRLTPGYRIGYASSLTGAVAILAGEDVLAKPETTGRLYSGVTVDILGEDGIPRPVGEIGVIKAWTKTMATAVLTPGKEPFVDKSMMGPNWGIPGDIGFMDEDRFLTIVDRQADVIVRGGVNVAPQEIEKLIRQHPKVSDVAVVGFDDATMGQEIAAFIVSERGTIEEFRDFLATTIQPDRRPRLIRIVASLPFSDHGKLLRRRLAEELRKN